MLYFLFQQSFHIVQFRPLLHRKILEDYFLLHRTYNVGFLASPAAYRLVALMDGSRKRMSIQALQRRGHAYPYKGLERQAPSLVYIRKGGTQAQG